MVKSINRKRQSKTQIKRWKTFNEKEVLECYFMLDPYWGRKTITYVKDLVKLSEEQIYKWGYERKRKDKANQESEIPKYFSSDDRTEKSKSSQAKNYNLMVDELFPMAEFNSEQLSDEELALYDKVKREIISNDKVLNDMTDLDRLLCERISLSDIIRSSKIDPPTIDSGKVSPKSTFSDKNELLENKEESYTNEISYESSISSHKNKR